MIESDYLKDNSALIQKLRQIPTLELFDEKELQGALQLSKIRKYEPGELILKEDSYDSGIYFLISGKVRVDTHGLTPVVLYNFLIDFKNPFHLNQM